MRVRLDSQGRPVKPAPTAAASSPPLPAASAAAPVAAPPPPPAPAAPPPSPPRPPSPPLPAPPPPPPADSPLPKSPPPQPDDERASDSGSSGLTEAYNSEDEHGDRALSRAAPPEAPARSLRERERHFSRALAARGLRIVEMRADGNCLFRALAHALWADAELHAALRAKVIEYLVQERDYFSQFVAEDFARYVRRKRRDGVHGNHLELQAASELFGRQIEVYSYSDTPANIIEPFGGYSGHPDPIRLSFHRGSHYNAVQPVHSTPQKAAPSVAKQPNDLLADVELTTADAQVTQDEVERAVLALSLVEASRGESAAGSSASSSASMLPSTVLALIHSGYEEDRAKEAYRVAGHGGLSEMVKYLTTDFFHPKGAARPPSGLRRKDKEGPNAEVSTSRHGGKHVKGDRMKERKPAASTALRKEGDTDVVHIDASSDSSTEASVE